MDNHLISQANGFSSVASENTTDEADIMAVNALADDQNVGSSGEGTNIDSSNGGMNEVNGDSDDDTDTLDGTDLNELDGSYKLNVSSVPMIKLKISPSQARHTDEINRSKEEERRSVVAPKASPIRIKLSLKKLPISGNKSNETDDSDRAGTVSKTVKDAASSGTKKMTVKIGKTVGFSRSRDDAITDGKTAPKVLPTLSKAATGTASKRRSLLPSKQVRLPPITSPGLRMLRPPIPLPSRTESTDPYFTPQQVFDVTMTGAGYTVEQRTKHPHRGSSVQRTVDDMFDTNVKLALHPLELVPRDLWNHKISAPSAFPQASDPSRSNAQQITLPQLLIQGLKDSKRKSLLERQHLHSESKESDARKRRRPPYAPFRFRDMVPVSLTIPFPESYIQNRMEYVMQVKHREDCIVQWQAAQDDFELALDGSDIATATDSDANTNNTSSNVKKSRTSFVNPITVPPIPEPPNPPHLHELLNPLSSSDEDDFVETESDVIPSISPYYYLCSDEDEAKKHPIYLPKGKEELVAHLDPKCFHITNGRYFGLRTNLIADPNFVGPSAPGLASVNTATGGLATSTTSTTTSTSGLTGGGMTMILSASFHSAAAVPATHVKDEIIHHGGSIKSHPQQDFMAEHPDIQIDSTTTSTCAPNVASVSSGASSVNQTPAEKSPNQKTETSVSMSSEDVLTGNAFELRKIMEGPDEALIETFRDGIVRAVVHAYRTRQPHNASFLAPNGKTYPDIGKAFAIYGGVKTCERCKNNKQGVFHCRIRRRHSDPDYDGGVTSASLLYPLLDAPMLGGES